MQKRMKKALSLLLLLTLLAVAALTSAGCRKESPYKPGTTAEGGEVGEGAKSFALTVTGPDGKEYPFTVHTDEETVGAALQKIGLLEGEDGPYGLYIKVVNGIVADFDADGTYWAFYVNGEYAMTGVDMTAVEEGARYALKVEK
mgnify:CR=1 FL=1